MGKDYGNKIMSPLSFAEEKADLYWEITQAKLKKADKGICYCDEEKKINDMATFPWDDAKCIFCISKTKDGKSYDPEDAMDKVKAIIEGGIK
jgi:hypothetical protein